LLKLNKSLVFSFLLFVNFSQAQSLTVSETVTSNTCSGTFFTFELLYTPLEISVTSFDFNDGTLPTGWDSTPYIVGLPCDDNSRANTPDGSKYFWALAYNSGNEFDNVYANPKVRYVETSAVDVSNGGSIEFLIRYGADDSYVGRGFENGLPKPNCEDPDEPKEQVYLQYSIDNGSTWTISKATSSLYGNPPFLNGVTWDTSSPGTDLWDTANNVAGYYSKPWYNWYANDIEIPESAKTVATKFRWYQPYSTNYFFDNWGLEDVNIKAMPPPVNSWVFDFGDLQTASSTLVSSTISITHLFAPSNQNLSRTISFTAILTDGSSVTVTKTIVVPASDTTPPVVTAPASITVSMDPGDCLAIITDIGSPVTSDNCSFTSIENNKPSNNQYSVGDTTVAWIVTDIASNTTTVIQTITVEDNEAPSLTIPANINSSTCSDITLLAANAADNCGSVTITNTIRLSTFPLTAQFNSNAGLIFDSLGNLFITDTYNHKIKKITPWGEVTTFAGSSQGDTDGASSTAQFNLPTGIGIDSKDNLFVADVANHRIRKITSAGVVTTFAGSSQGFADGNGTIAQFNNPNSIAFDSSGNLFIGDSSNERIRKITSAGVVTTFAGSSQGDTDGASSTAQFNTPFGIGIDSSNNLYVADMRNHKIRKITPLGVVTTFAGSSQGDADGTGTEAKFNNPKGVIIDPSGNLIVADLVNHKIRKITSAGVVTTFAGSSPGETDGNGTLAQFNLPNRTVLDPAGNIYVADLGNHRIRKITSGGDVSTFAGSTQGDRDSDKTINNYQSFFAPGDTAVLWQATDSSENITTKAQLITVVDNTPPTGTVTPITLPTDTGVCYATVTADILMQYTADPTDECQLTPLNITNDTRSQLAVGVHSVTYIITDDSGNSTTITQTVTIEDISPPIITPPETKTVNTCVYILTPPQITDNCSVYTYKNDAPQPFPVGNTMVTWTVSDSYGNTVTATQNVIVNDNANPTISVGSNIMIGADLGSCFATSVNLGTPLYTDDCSSSTIGNNAQVSYPIGVTTVTWVVTDAIGNATSAIQFITVVDNEKPVARGKDIVIDLNGNGRAKITKEQLNDGSSDNCVIESIGIDKYYKNPNPNPNTNQGTIDTTSTFSSKSFSNSSLKNENIFFTCDDVGVQKITLLVTDSFGNTDSVVVNITVVGSSACPSFSTPSTPSTPSSGTDSDGDGFSDSVDAFAADPLEWVDTDNDSIGNNADFDDDADGFSDVIEISAGSDPLNMNSIPLDTDSDGIYNLLDLDDDGDGFSDVLEKMVGSDDLSSSSFPLDTDNDNTINYYDQDDDNDGQLDTDEDVCGSDSLNYQSFSLDTDLDGIPNCIDLDDDGDGFSDVEEINEGTEPEDKKSYPFDYDGDGLAGSRDNCFNAFNPGQLNADADYYGDACDNCIDVYNNDQKDYDLDQIGDLCDLDSDGDGQSNLDEIKCQSDPLDENSLSPDYDGDGIPDCIDEDDDNDTQSDIDEINCGSNPLDASSMSPDFDNDGILDCDDFDIDNDLIDNSIDPNPYKYDDLLITEFVSANGDGINDYWRIIPVDRYPNNEIWIYSRSGNLIYNKKNYRNEWSGDYKGNSVPESSYLYMIDFNGNGKIDNQGWFYLSK
jgi:gliding motility-associated-like protein